MRPGLGLVTGVAATVAAGVVLAVIPFLTSDYHCFELARMGIFFVAILGLNILTGYTGQISIGHSAFMSIGGYTTAIVVTRAGVPDYATIPMAALLTGAVGLAVGVPALRLSGLYLALATFGLAVALPAIQKNDELDGLTKGTTGIFWKFHTGRWTYGVVWAVAAVLFVAAWALLRSRVGRAFKAIRDSEVAAASVGVNTAFYKTLAFGISAFYAGAAGALYGMANNSYVNPDVYPISLSFDLLIGAVIGGLGSLVGVIAGAAFVQYVPIHASAILNTVSPWNVGEKTPGVPDVIFGGILVLLMLLLPTGAAGLLRRVFSPLTSRLYTRS